MAHVIRGMAAGLLAGCAASWIMQAFGSMEPVNPPRRQSKEEEQSSEAGQTGSERGGNSRHHQEQEQISQEALTNTAVAVSRNVFGHELTENEKRMAAPAVHYGYGSLVGALYGGIAELAPGVAAGLGMPFGAALWLLGDEVAVPALGLIEKSPRDISPEAHADGLASHFMYGMTTDLLRRFLRHVI